MELGLKLEPDVPAIAAKVPGSVQQALRGAGIIPDWNVGLNSRACEWVEHRHWIFRTTLPEAWTSAPGRKVLRCAGLDYQGTVLVNGKEAGKFCGTFVPHEFDLTGHLRQGPNELAMAFTGAPPFLGQIGYTSQITEWKARFNYAWDWCPRLVQIGIWDALELSVDTGDAIEQLRAYTNYDATTQRGELTLEAELRLSGAESVEVVISGAEGEVLRQSYPASRRFHIRVPGIVARPWHPNGQVEQPLYELQVRLLDAAGKLLDENARTVGFRQIAWKAAAGAPKGAEPWVCHINGRVTFLQGFNWVPLLPNFADVTKAQYRQALQTYREMGVNLLRVWGGAVLERECFYRLCDEMGILIWQEFPLSSSGIDNWPPEEPAAIAAMEDIAASYIWRRQHHPSLLLWCGGNELQGSHDGGKIGGGKPVDASHPMIAALQQTVRRLDPARRFLATSSTGPRFTANQAEFGHGLHHDVHGPWNHCGDLASWNDYWDHDDALFRSEAGMPGASSFEVLHRYAADHALPADKSNPYYLHISAWWIQWEDYLASGGNPADLAAYVTWSQTRQAEALTHAARVCKKRFPAIGGIIFWMGHDCFPCPVNTSVIDFSGAIKPAGEAVAKVFRGE